MVKQTRGLIHLGRRGKGEKKGVFLLDQLLLSLCEHTGAGNDALRIWGGRAGVVTSVAALKAHSKGTLVTDVTSPAGLSKNTLQENSKPFHSSNSRYLIQIFPLWVRSCVSFLVHHHLMLLLGAHNNFILIAAYPSYYFNSITAPNDTNGAKKSIKFQLNTTFF